MSDKSMTAGRKKKLSIASMLILVLSMLMPASIAAAGDATLDRIGIQTSGAYQVTANICVAVDLNRDGDVTQIEINAAVEEDILNLVTNATLIIALLVPGACDAFVPAPDGDDTVVDDLIDDQLDLVDDVVDAGIDDELDVLDDVVDAGVDDEIDLIDGNDSTDGTDTVVDDLIDDQLDLVDDVVDAGIDDELDVVDDVVDNGIDDEIDLIDGSDAADAVDAGDGVDAGDATDTTDAVDGGADAGDSSDGGADAGDSSDGGADAGDSSDGGADAGDSSDGGAGNTDGGGSAAPVVNALPSTGSGSTMSNILMPTVAASMVLLMLGGHFVISGIKQRQR